MLDSIHSFLKVMALASSISPLPLLPQIFLFNVRSAVAVFLSDFSPLVLFLLSNIPHIVFSYWMKFHPFELATIQIMELLTSNSISETLLPVRKMLFFVSDNIFEAWNEGQLSWFFSLFLKCKLCKHFHHELITKSRKYLSLLSSSELLTILAVL